MTSLLVALIHLYRRFVSPWTPQACRFMPSCSQYAEEALRAHGFVRGLVLAVRRLVRCHPWGGKGFDPVPARPVRKEA